jgi:predicted transcriptional regulator YdeE
MKIARQLSELKNDSRQELQKNMDNKIQLDAFKIVGISVRTTNENGQSMTDMGQLWTKFYADNILPKIPDRINDDIYSIYTDYQSDYRGAYTAIIGCKVKSLDNIPNGLIGKEFPKGNYWKFIGKGEMPNAVIDKWKEIWGDEKNLNRKYTIDFEVYGEKSQDPNNAEVDIYIATE